MSKTANNTGKTTIELDYPIQVDGTEVRSLQMRRPKVRDQLTVMKQGKTEEEREIHLFANLCEISIETIEELDMKDYGKIQEAYKDFLAKA